MDKRFQVWLLHPESSCEAVECTFDTAEEAYKYINSEEAPDGGLGWREVRDATGAPVKSFMDLGDELLG